MSEEKKVMCHVFLISYACAGGFGNFYNYREIGKSKGRPSESDIEAMMEKVLSKHSIGKAVVLSVSELQDQMVPVTMLDF